MPGFMNFAHEPYSRTIALVDRAPAQEATVVQAAQNLSTEGQATRRTAALQLHNLMRMQSGKGPVSG